MRASKLAMAMEELREDLGGNVSSGVSEFITDDLAPDVTINLLEDHTFDPEVLESAVETLRQALESQDLYDNLNAYVSSDKATPEDKAALGIVGETMMARTQRHLAAEGFADVKEAIGSFAKKAWKWIVELIRKMIEMVKNFFTSIAGIKKKVTALKQKVETLPSGKFAGADKISASNAPLGFFTHKGAPQNGAAYLMELKHTAAFIKNVPSAVSAVSEILHEAHVAMKQVAARADPIIVGTRITNNDVLDNVQVVIADLWHNSVLNKLSITTEIKGRNKEGGSAEIYHGGPFLGATTVEATIPDPKDYSNQEHRGAGFRRYVHALKFKTIKDYEAIEAAHDAEFEVLSKEELEKVIDYAESVLYASEELTTVYKSKIMVHLRFIENIVKVFGLKEESAWDSKNHAEAHSHAMIALANLAGSLMSIPTAMIHDTLRGALFVTGKSLQAHAHFENHKAAPAGTLLLQNS